MDIRTRVLSVLNHQKPDRVPWLGDLDYWITGKLNLQQLPEKYQGKGIFRLHRDLGVGFYLQGFFPFTTQYEGVEITVETPVNRRITQVKTPAGDLESVEVYLPESACLAFTERFVKSWRDLAPLRYLFEHMYYEPDYRVAQERYELVGDQGVVLCYTPKSPLMELVALQAGISAVTFALADAPEEFEATLAVLRKKADEGAAITLASPAECIMIPENLSSEVVGKRLYNRYMRDYEECWNRKIREAGKYSFIHMDGTLNGLLDEVATAGFCVMEALTPAPAGDLPLEEIGRRVGEQAVVWGGLPGIYFTDLVSDEEFDRFVIHVLEIMRGEPRYVLGVADQVPPGSRWERIARVAELVEKYGVME
ncbi:MAG: uroporphyrinogen decarboxylase family protein [Omnitrophica WOR_2 bacterium]